MSRKFQRPSGLDAQSQVVLEIDVGAMLAQPPNGPVALAVECSINTTMISAVHGSDSCWHAAIDWTKLQPTNELTIRVEWYKPESGALQLELPSVGLCIS